MTEEAKKVWQVMEKDFGWSNQPKDFHLEYFEDIVKATTQTLRNNDNSAKAVASIEQIEEVARQYFEVKYPLMDLTTDEDKCEIDWWDMLQFVQHVLSCHYR
jgi:hypothetical protein